MTARQNMAFALENAKVPREEVAARVASVAKMLELEDLLDTKPAAMSGGQPQRVSMGRAIVRQPQVFLMDEPLSNLDARLRVSTRAQIASLQRELGVTTLYVTHDQTEAMTMGDRVAVLKDGELQQVDAPLNLYRYPGNTFVAGFIGSPAMSLFDDVPVAGRTAALADGVDIPMPDDLVARSGEKVVVGVRPEDWEISEASPEPEGAGASGRSRLPVVIEHIEQLGSEAFAYCTARSETCRAVRGGKIALRIDTSADVAVGQSMTVFPRRCSFFDAETEVNLRYLGE